MAKLVLDSDRFAQGCVAAFELYYRKNGDVFKEFVLVSSNSFYQFVFYFIAKISTVNKLSRTFAKSLKTQFNVLFIAFSHECSKFTTLQIILWPTGPKTIKQCSLRKKIWAISLKKLTSSKIKFRLNW